MPPLAVTLGEPAGIGPDITLAAWVRRRADGLPAFLVFGDPELLRARARALGLDVAVRETAPERAAAVFEDALPVHPTGPRASAPPGRPDATSAPAAVAAVDAAVAAVRTGAAAAVVTNPIAKSVLTAAGFAFHGHTDYLAHLDRRDGTAPRAVMMLWSPQLAVVPVTVHVPLAEVPRRLTRALIVETATIAVRDLVRRFGLAAPRVAVAGLNPHAGESGTLGREDEDVVRPAVADLVAAGIKATGPLSADTLFHAAARARYDVALAMYHDQALIPIKTLAFEQAVNVTLGLSFVRTSPDHGTAFDIAGTGRADPSSLIAALTLAQRLSAR